VPELWPAIAHSAAFLQRRSLGSSPIKLQNKLPASPAQPPDQLEAVWLAQMLGRGTMGAWKG
jgi:hypothetical protein